MSDFRPLRLAIVGLGKIARDQHLPAIASDSRFELVATVDPAGGLPDVPGFPSIEQMLKAGASIDAVTIATPPQVRESVARCALAAGLHVFLEKPPASTVLGAMKLEDAAALAGRTLFASWHSREASSVSKARSWLSGREIAHGSIRWRENARQWHPGQHWLWQPGGLGVLDPAINAFSILTAISTERLSVGDIAFEMPENQHAPIGVTGSLIGAQGMITLDLDFREMGEPCWEIDLHTVDGGVLLLSEGGHKLLLDGTPQPAGTGAEYTRLYAHFADLIARGASDVDLSPLQLVADAFAVARVSRSARYDP